MTWQWCLLKNGFKLPCPFCILLPIHDLLCPAAQGYRQVLEIRNATNPALYQGGRKLDVRLVSYRLDVDRVANKYLGWYGSSGVISWDRKINSLIFIASHALLKFVKCLVSCFVTKHPLRVKQNQTNCPQHLQQRLTSLWCLGSWSHSIHNSKVFSVNMLWVITCPKWKVKLCEAIRALFRVVC